MQPLLPTGGLGKKAEAEEQGSLAASLSESGGGRKKQNEETTTEETLLEGYTTLRKSTIQAKEDATLSD